MKGYVFHCQLDYEDVPYPCTATGFGTVADNGCGPCCASMVAENMLHISFPVQEACRLAIACGARDKPGTDMHVFGDRRRRGGPSVSCPKSGYGHRQYKG